MNTFDTIVYKTINLKNNIFSPKYDNTDTVTGIHKIFFYGLINIKTTNLHKSKLQFFNETINNFYLCEKHEERNEFMDYFRKIQRTYHTLNRLCFVYKIKKAKQIVNSDLELNEISLGQKNVISIYHNNYNYLFKIQDLLKIIYTSLTDTYMFFCEPITIKNPYNNLPFEKSILYYIYFYLINNTYIGYTKHEYIDIFLKFKQCNFNMTKFVDKYEYILREHAIKNYITNSTKIQLRIDILKMLREYNACNEKNAINIDYEFPADVLIRIMKPYLTLYLTAFYSLIPKNKTNAKYKLSKKLKEFQKFNPSFGRKVIVFKDKILNGRFVRYKSHTDFNYEHKKFNIYTSENFMNNHLLYKYNDDNIDDNDDNQEYNENMFESIASSTHHTMTNVNLFRFYIVDNNRQINNEVHEYAYQNNGHEYEETEEIIQSDDEDANLENDLNSELAEDYYDEIPDEDSIS
jgi:hypothetical protein